MKDQLTSSLTTLNIKFTDIQISQTLQYLSLLSEWNKKIDLTAVPDDQMIERHIINSLTPTKHFDFTKHKNLIDIGTGAGLPGIPLKIAFPQLEITLLDSLNKRIKFLDIVIQELGLKNIETIHGRAEELGMQTHRPVFREKFDIAIARAVAGLPILIELIMPLVRVGGYGLAMKGEKVKEELVGCDKILSAVGGKIQNIDQLRSQLGSAEESGNLIQILKVSSCRAGFPRNFKQIKNNLVML